MSDRAAPKAKKPAKDKDKKATGPKLVTKDLAPIGHNMPHTGEVNPEAVKCLEEIMAYQEQKKAIAKAERDVRNRLKTEFGILASSVAREVALRKLDVDVRVQVETNHEDFKKMLGYQPSLDFNAGVATEASQKAQPKEAELEARGKTPTPPVERSTEPQRAAAPAKGFAVKDADEQEEGEEDDSNVITREG